MEEVAVLIARSQAGDKQAREILIEKNLGLVHHIVKRFIGRGYEAEDLFQIGCIGLMKAIDKFDLTFEVKFSTYAVPMISGEIKRFLRDDGIVKISRSVKENGFKANIARERLLQRLGREPSINEVAQEAQLSLEEIILAMEASVEVESIYKSVYQSDGSEVFLVDKIVHGGNGKVVGNSVTSGSAPGMANTDYEKEEVLNHMLLEQLLSELDEKERELISMRYFQEQTQTQVAQKLGISQVQVSRMEKKILVRMRARAIY